MVAEEKHEEVAEETPKDDKEPKKEKGKPRTGKSPRKTDDKKPSQKGDAGPGEEVPPKADEVAEAGKVEAKADEKPGVEAGEKPGVEAGKKPGVEAGEKPHEVHDRKAPDIPHRRDGKPDRGRRPRDGRRPNRREKPPEWEPKTRLGILVKKGEIKTMADALETGYPLREPEIVDVLLPELDDEVLDVNMVQRMTDSGRRVRFAIITVVGNGDGYVGLGKATGKEVGPAIRKSIDNAKLNMIEIKRGCGSWECGCGEPHSLPFVVKGKSGSTEVHFKPAPRGISLAVGDVAKHILRLAGVEDSWGFTSGKTRTTVNYAKAAFDALSKTSEMRVLPEQESRLHIHKGSVGKSTIMQGGDEE